MKKLIAAILILTLAFALTACGESKTASAPEDVSSEQSAPIPDEPTGTGNENPESSEPTETPEPEKPSASSEKPVSSEKPASSKPATNPVSSQKPTSSTPVTSKKPTSSEKPQVTVKNEYFASNTAAVKDDVYIRPKHVYWLANGELEAECYVINGFARPVNNITISSFKVFDAQNRLIASGAFDARGMASISPNMNRIHTFTFGTDCIKIPGAKLSDGVRFEFELNGGFAS